MRTPYEILGVAKEATADDIKAAFRHLAQQHHPDRNPGDANAPARFKEINAAYQILSDPQKRTAFDTYGTGWGPPTPHEIPPDISVLIHLVEEAAPAVMGVVSDIQDQGGVWAACKAAGGAVAEQTKTPEGQERLRKGASLFFDAFKAITGR